MAIKKNHAAKILGFLIFELFGPAKSQDSRDANYDDWNYTHNKQSPSGSVCYSKKK
jgi:hypothetical protein